MDATIGNERYCTIEESIVQSCKEVKEIRAGERKGISLDELFSSIMAWEKEENKMRLEDLKNKLLKNPEVKQEYDKIIEGLKTPLEKCLPENEVQWHMKKEEK